MVTWVVRNSLPSRILGQQTFTFPLFRHLTNIRSLSVSIICERTGKKATKAKKVGGVAARIRTHYLWSPILPTKPAVLATELFPYRCQSGDREYYVQVSPPLLGQYASNPERICEHFRQGAYKPDCFEPFRVKAERNDCSSSKNLDFFCPRIGYSQPIRKGSY